MNLDINEGEFICFIGKNGSGKSSLMNLISGILKPTSGDVLVDDINTKVKKETVSKPVTKQEAKEKKEVSLKEIDDRLMTIDDFLNDDE